MRQLIAVKGRSQYDEEVQANYRNSACGPTTFYVMLDYLLPNGSPYSINSLYKLLQTTKIGLFRWVLIRNARKLLGSDWLVRSCNVQTALREIDAGRPVAMKFDKYFTFRFFTQPEFSYHWVPLIGYEQIGSELLLFIHDNGGKNRPSQVRKIRYSDNEKVVSFVQITPYTNE